MKEKFNFAVVGCGNIGKRHCSILKNMQEAELVAVYDAVKERADNFAQEFNVKAYYDYAELLANNEIDFVNICVPSGLHAEQCIKAAAAGKHIICEKPMALSVEDCDKMIEAAAKNNVKIFVVKQNRYNEPVQKLKEAIDKGKMGKIYLLTANILWNRNEEYYKEASWRGTQALDGGALMNQSSHFVDLLNWLGGNVKSVYAKMDTISHDIETDDTGIVILKFENGSLGNIIYTTCVYDKNMEGSITILGTKGTVKIGGQYLNKIEHWNVEGIPKPEIVEQINPNLYSGGYQGSAASHDKFFQNVIDVMKGKTNSTVIGSDGKKAVEIILAAKKSAETRQEVFLR